MHPQWSALVAELPGAPMAVAPHVKRRQMAFRHYAEEVMRQQEPYRSQLSTERRRLGVDQVHFTHGPWEPWRSRARAPR